VAVEHVELAPGRGEQDTGRRLTGRVRRAVTGRQRCAVTDGGQKGAAQLSGLDGARVLVDRRARIGLEERGMCVHVDRHDVVEQRATRRLAGRGRRGAAGGDERQRQRALHEIPATGRASEGAPPLETARSAHRGATVAPGGAVRNNQPIPS
jgi:hypothetical protein